MLIVWRFKVLIVLQVGLASVVAVDKHTGLIYRLPMGVGTQIENETHIPDGVEAIRY